MAQEIADSTLLETWSSGGNIVKPDSTKIIEGWQLGEQPPHEYMNWLQNTFGSKLNHILKNGVAGWNNTTQYLAGSSVQHNGNVWLCKTTNTNSTPTDANSNWKRIITVESLPDILNDYVALTGDQTISGVKTFSSTISGSISGNSATVTNGVYTTGNQTIAGVKTFAHGVTMSSGGSDTSDLTFEDPINKTSFLIDMAVENFRVYKNFREGGYAPILNIPANTGVFEFAVSPIVPTPTTGTQVANKEYADLKVALASFIGTNQSLSGSGYQKLPGELIIQWATVTESESASDYKTFPIAFPTTCFMVDIQINSNTPLGLGENSGTVVQLIDRTKFIWIAGGAFGGGGVAYMFAIGY